MSAPCRSSAPRQCAAPQGDGGALLSLCLITRAFLSLKTPQGFGIAPGDNLNLKHYEHTYGMAVLDKVNHTYYVTVRLTPHVNGLVEVRPQGRAGCSCSKAVPLVL